MALKHLRTFVLVGKALVLRTIWRFEGESKMLAVTEQQKDGQWVEAWRITFSRE